jgi:hypothetical protein
MAEKQETQMDVMTYAAFQLDAHRAAAQQREIAMRASHAARAAAAEQAARTTPAGAGVDKVRVCEQDALALAGPAS